MTVCVEGAADKFTTSGAHRKSSSRLSDPHKKVWVLVKPPCNGWGGLQTKSPETEQFLL